MIAACTWSSSCRSSVAYLAHAPVLRYDLLRSLKRPLDGGATIRGRRVFGDNKTWRGAIVMFAGTVRRRGRALSLRLVSQRAAREVADAAPIRLRFALVAVAACVAW